MANRGDELGTPSAVTHATEAQRAAYAQSGYHRVLLRDNFTCQYCGLFAGKDADTWFHARLNVDHVIPVRHFTALTGQPVEQADDDANLVAACSACNNSKAQFASRTLEEARGRWAQAYAEKGEWFTKFIVPNRREVG